MYRNILVPTDGSDGTELAVEHAIDLAHQYDATLHVLHVVETPTTFPADITLERVLDHRQSKGEAAKDEVVEQAEAAGVTNVVGDVREGTPHLVIREYAENNDVDLVVMGTHGRAGMDRLLLGSVADRVVRTVDAPVMLVRMPQD